MIIGIPKEIKNNENRISMTPAGICELTKQGHTVLVENNGGSGSGFENDEYINAGAETIDNAEDVWSLSNIIVKVKEPIISEYKRLTRFIQV